MKKKSKEKVLVEKPIEKSKEEKISDIEMLVSQGYLRREDADKQIESLNE